MSGRAPQPSGSGSLEKSCNEAELVTRARSAKRHGGGRMKHWWLAMHAEESLFARQAAQRVEGGGGGSGIAGGGERIALAAFALAAFELTTFALAAGSGMLSAGRVSTAGRACPDPARTLSIYLALSG